jgi:ParB family transcriptional regulator, chromosome partitioning protein
MGKQANKLGKGLGAIFQDKGYQEDIPGTETLAPKGIPVSKISPNPFQPRRRFNDDEIIELADTIKSHGLLQPIVVRKHQDAYQIVAGERRFRAIQFLEWTEVEARVFETLSDKQMAEWALIENIQRVELSPMEEATSYQQLINNHGYTHDDLAKRLGKSRSAITNTLRLSKLPEPVQLMVENKQLSAGHARSLLGLENPDLILERAQQIVSDGLSVRETEQLNKKPPKAGNAKKTSGSAHKDPNLIELESQLQYSLGTKVQVHLQKEQGKISIFFSTIEDLNRIQKLITKA